MILINKPALARKNSRILCSENSISIITRKDSSTSNLDHKSPNRPNSRKNSRVIASASPQVTEPVTTKKSLFKSYCNFSLENHEIEIESSEKEDSFLKINQQNSSKNLIKLKRNFSKISKFNIFSENEENNVENSISNFEEFFEPSVKKKKIL